MIQGRAGDRSSTGAEFIATRLTKAITRGVDDRRFIWRAERATWSVAQCLTHLCKINEIDFQSRQ